MCFCFADLTTSSGCRRSLADVGATSQTASVTEEYGAAAAAAAFSSAAQESPRVSKYAKKMSCCSTRGLT